MARTRKSDEPPVYNRLPALRAERGLSRQQVADAVGVHYQTIGYLERGEYKPSLVLALRIAALFSLPVEAIFSLEPLAPMSEQLYSSNRKATHD
ncbi:MAG: helix-turn-helix transcriptional regulator [Pseudomonadota bacterium]